MALGEILLAGCSGQSRAGKMAPSIPLGQPITARGLVHLARSRSQPYNKKIYHIYSTPCSLEQQFNLVIYAARGVQRLYRSPNILEFRRALPDFRIAMWCTSLTILLLSLLHAGSRYVLENCWKSMEENVFFPENGMTKKERLEDYPPLVLIINQWVFPYPSQVSD